MVNRREFLGATIGAGATLTLSPQLLRALQQSSGKLIQRAIPSTGEMLPVISFAPRSVGGAAMSSQPVDVATIRAVLKPYLDNGGKVVDVMHGGAAGEESARTAANELGIQDRFFWTTQMPGTPQGPGGMMKVEPAVVRAAVEEKFAKYRLNKIDLAMVGSLSDVTTQLAVLREMKKEGRVRYIGVHHLVFPPGGSMPAFGNLESIMRNEEIDVVATDYSVGDRRAEETILPLAQERKIGFMSYFPFDRGRLFKRIGTTPLPAWAAEFDAKTWAQFCLKYVLSHPSVIVAREGTTNAAHMLDNIGGGIGRLPNEAMRQRMAQLVDSLPTLPPGPLREPVVLSAAILDRYVGEYTTPAGSIVTFRREGSTLFVKLPDPNPEVPLTARSEIRFGNPQARVFEFHVDSQGKVTGALMEQGPQPLKLVRK
jgi:aryl-alcohol dehydrogenase-like predicted oxidoreductase